MAAARKIKTLLTVNILVFVGIVLFSVYCRIQDRSEELVQLGRSAEARARTRHGKVTDTDRQSILQRLERLEDVVYNQLNGMRVHSHPTHTLQPVSVHWFCFSSTLSCSRGHREHPGVSWESRGDASHVHPQVQFSISPLSAKFFSGRRKPENPEETCWDTGRTRETLERHLTRNFPFM